MNEIPVRCRLTCKAKIPSHCRPALGSSYVQRFGQSTLCNYIGFFCLIVIFDGFHLYISMRSRLHCEEVLISAKINFLEWFAHISVNGNIVRVLDQITITWFCTCLVYSLVIHSLPVGLSFLFTRYPSEDIIFLSVSFWTWPNLS